ncbi:MAG: SprT family zinc-dependent metalloprotease [Candidatus Andersenbacteria bacterium]
MPSTVTVAEQTYPVRLKRSRRARRLTLRVATDGIVIVIPQRLPAQLGWKFLSDHQTWLTRVLKLQQRREQQLPQRHYISGEKIPFLGSELTLQVKSASRSKVHYDALEQTLSIEHPARTAARTVIEKWYREQAQLYFTATATGLAATIGARFTTISIRQAKTRWGSCSSRGTLSFNWRLLLAPAGIAHYVTAHEVAHLKHLHHQPRFWRLVAELDPAYLEHKRWLKHHGRELVL